MAHRQALAQATVSELADAVIDAISDPDNIAANLTMLINFLVQIADVLSGADRTLVASKLRPLASGSLPASIIDAQAYATNPLNPFQMQTGSPQEVQGIALMAIATLASGRTHPVLGDERDTLVSLIDVGLEHKSSDVRRFAVAAPAIPVSGANHPCDARAMRAGHMK